MTGGYSGLGLEMVRAMRAAGAHVGVPARRRAHAADVLALVDRAEVDALDLGDLDSVHAFADDSGARRGRRRPGRGALLDRPRALAETLGRPPLRGRLRQVEGARIRVRA